MTAFNPVSKESFQGQYRVMLTGGGTSTGVVRDSWGWTAGTVTTTSDPKAAGRGFLKGDKGTVIDVSLTSHPLKVTPRMAFSFSFPVKERGLTTAVTVTRFFRILMNGPLHP